MLDQFQADGDTWQITSGEVDDTHAVRTIVFHCVSDIQRPYRVVQVAEPVLAGKSIEALTEDELTTLFNRSHTMDYVHDPAARPESHGYGDPPIR
jgi:hypothetical protein